MDSEITPWDTIEQLEKLAGIENTFSRRWHAFVRSCGRLIENEVPAKARIWLKIADDFDQACISVEELKAASNHAWAFFLSVKDTLPWPTQNAILIVLTSLANDFDASRWYEGASHFLNCCEAAGITDQQLAILLTEYFGSIEEE